ncbi:hypothetical protein AMECASPLE_018359, partial [Ameca splendens]
PKIQCRSRLDHRLQNPEYPLSAHQEPKRRVLFYRETGRQMMQSTWDFTSSCTTSTTQGRTPRMSVDFSSAFNTINPDILHYPAHIAGLFLSVVYQLPD